MISMSVIIAGKLTQEQIKAGYTALKKIDKCITAEDWGARLVQACDEFYTRIPHSFGCVEFQNFYFCHFFCHISSHDLPVVNNRGNQSIRQNPLPNPIVDLKLTNNSPSNIFQLMISNNVIF